MFTIRITKQISRQKTDLEKCSRHETISEKSMRKKNLTRKTGTANGQRTEIEAPIAPKHEEMLDLNRD